MKAYVDCKIAYIMSIITEMLWYRRFIRYNKRSTAQLDSFRQLRILNGRRLPKTIPNYDFSNYTAEMKNAANTDYISQYICSFSTVSRVFSVLEASITQ